MFSVGDVVTISLPDYRRWWQKLLRLGDPEIWSPTTMTVISKRIEIRDGEGFYVTVSGKVIE